METPPPPPSSKESTPERILTSEEVLEELSKHAEGYVLGRELSDEKGVYLKEVTVEGEAEGEMTEYQYMRKGTHPNNNASNVTAVSAIYYEDGIPVGGKRLATLNEATGQWETL